MVLTGGLAWLAVGRAFEAPEKTSSPAASASPAREGLEEAHAVAESLWNEYAPEEIKSGIELIGSDELVALFNNLETIGQQEDLARLAAYAPEARAALLALRAWPEFADYTDWLAEQLDDMEAAVDATKPTTPPQPLTPTPALPSPIPPIPPPTKPDAPPKVVPPGAGIPFYDLWLARISKRTRPARADEFLPVARAAFAAEGVPEALVWLAETESTFNPRARSPVGALGLFQLMPATAKSLGLALRPSDQRAQPEASARAAAAYLKKLHARFGDWPLALAAYNAGEGRIGRLLKARGARDFAGIAAHLPAETKLYVPKVLATVQVRAGVRPEALAAPGGG